jgi:hypothetical protein
MKKEPAKNSNLFDEETSKSAHPHRVQTQTAVSCLEGLFSAPLPPNEHHETTVPNYFIQHHALTIL